MFRSSLLCTAVLLALLPLAGCKPKPKEVPKAVRAEAAQHASEADFATQIGDHARAEAALRRSVELDPEISGYWLQLGFSCRRQDKRKDARNAYEKCLALREAAYKKEKKAGAAIEQIEVLALLGRVDDAKALAERIRRDHPNDPDVKNFLEPKFIDRMLAAPNYKALAL